MTQEQFNWLQNNLIVDDTGGGLRLKVELDGSSVTVSENLAQIGGNAVSAGNGVSGTGVLRVAQVSDGTGVLAGVTTVTTLTGTTSLTPGTAAANLGKAEDAPSANGDTGVASIAVRKLTPANTSDTDGDYEMLQMNAGKLWVSSVGDVADNAPQVQTSPNYVGGKAVTTASYAPAYTTSDAAGVAVDKDNGGILVNQANLNAAQDEVATYEKPDATSTYTPSSDVSAALEASSVSKASAGVFYGLSGHNTLASAQWILVYNSATVPADGAVTPIVVIRAAANSNFSFDTGKFGIYCSAGICWSNSTNASIFTKTLGAADCFVHTIFR